jgi:hypothetical protein
MKTTDPSVIRYGGSPVLRGHGATRDSSTARRAASAAARAARNSRGPPRQPLPSSKGK